MNSDESPHRIGRPSKATQFISLDNGRLRAITSKGRTFLIDVIDSDLLKVAWKCHHNKYVIRTIYKKGDYAHEAMHRVIMERVIGRALHNSEHVDHIDGNGLNNCRCNLRIASQSQNMANSRLSKANRSGFKGVFRQGRRWRSKLGKTALGIFDTPEEAHAAYCKAAREKYGEFANFGDLDRV